MPKSDITRPANAPASAQTYADAYPSSTKVYEEKTVPTPHGDVLLRVPVREVALAGNEPAVRLYDTSGPQGFDPREGLPKLRAEWVRPRRASTGSGTADIASPSSTTRARARSRRRWSSSRCARGCRPISSAARWRAAAPSSPPTSTTSSSSR